MESQDRMVQQKIAEELNKLLLTEADLHFQQITSTQRKKRPVRLLPARILQGERKNNTDHPPIRRFYGPPSNCSDLALLGYTLNGITWSNPMPRLPLVLISQILRLSIGHLNNQRVLLICRL